MRLGLNRGLFAGSLLTGTFCLVHTVWVPSAKQTGSFVRHEVTDGAVVVSDESGHPIGIRPYGSS